MVTLPLGRRVILAAAASCASRLPMTGIRVRLDLGRGHRHDDGGPAAQALGGEGHALGVVARRSGDDAAAPGGFIQVGDLVVGTPQLEGEHRLQILPA